MNTNATLSNWEQRFISYLQANHQSNDGSHDLHHFRRVWHTAYKLLDQEGSDGDPLIILAAAYFHDFISLPKNHPEASLSSKMSADKVAEILRADFKDFPEEKIAGVQHAIHAHSFSAQVTPLTIEAKVLQDADRMEAIGAIGIARVFYTAGLLHKDLFEPVDLLAENRALDDKQYALDHFQQKLLKLPGMMNTAAGKAMALDRADYLRDFMDRICTEIAI